MLMTAGFRAATDPEVEICQPCEAAEGADVAELSLVTVNVDGLGTNYLKPSSQRIMGILDIILSDPPHVLLLQEVT